MNTMLLVAIIAMTTALISYSIGVWGEKRAGTIKPVHLAAFWFGLLCDTAGTEMMRLPPKGRCRARASTSTPRSEPPPSC